MTVNFSKKTFSNKTSIKMTLGMKYGLGRHKSRHKFTRSSAIGHSNLAKFVKIQYNIPPRDRSSRNISFARELIAHLGVINQEKHCKVSPLVGWLCLL